ncbi:hypothetical protein PPERSA_05717 [Pseudocohnilembus persalinus]|uniref:FH2 domain-containing protein n=1 Tax=Pseudocohnilembus persalinus TaxID=266149 RepID=A0A0V0QI59_PSEPJ|nr:hypothetical protein PPERSA_05717 [Pseudocohnilembus persalinus]|eukprot:KRX01878.1 hypothetical protein PPERSA_05717 [Pseudocohnilembus persalinus]
MQPKQAINTIWKDVDDTKIKVDKEYLESNFAKPQPKKPVSGAKEVAAKPPVPEKVSLLDQDRQKNVEIVLGKLRTSYSLLKNALIISDEKILTRSNLESLKNIIPNQMEADMIKGYLEDGDIEKLGNPEKFMAEIIQVKGYEARVKGHLFIKQYEEIFEELEPKVTQLKDGFDYLLKSKKLKDIFEHTLALGNYLNGTSARGGAYGFKLDSLEKSNDVRYEDNKRTLLMYIMDLIVEKHNGEDFITEKEQEYLTMISRLPVSQLRIDFSEINIGFRNIDKGIKTQTDDPNDTIKEKFEPYCGKIEERKNKLESEIKEAEELYAKCSKYFCENPTESSEKFGEKFMKFCKSVQSAKRIKKQVEDQIRRNKEKEEKEKKKMEDQKKLQSQSSQNTQNSQESQKKLGGLAALKQNIQSSLKSKGDGDITNSLQTTFNSDFRKSKVPVVGFRQSYYNAKNPQDIINNLKENKQNKQGAAMPMPGFLAELQAKQKQK